MEFTGEEDKKRERERGSEAAAWRLLD